MTPELDSPQDAPDQKMHDASTVEQPSDAPEPAAKPASARSPKATGTRTKPAVSGVKTPSNPRSSDSADDATTTSATRKPAARKPAARKPAAPKAAAPKAATPKTGSASDSARVAPAKKPVARTTKPKVVTAPVEADETTVEGAEVPAAKPARATPRATAATKPAAAASGRAKSGAAASTAQPRSTRPSTTKATSAQADLEPSKAAVVNEPPAAPKAAGPAVKAARPAAKAAKPAARIPRPAESNPDADAPVEPVRGVDAPEPAVVFAPTERVAAPTTDDVPAPEATAVPTENALLPVTTAATDDAAEPATDEAAQPVTRATPTQASPRVKRTSSTRSTSPSAPRTGPGKNAKRAPAKRAPLTLAAQVTSGDFAITAPSGTPKTAATSAVPDDTATAVLPVEHSPAPDTHVPPLPALSPEEAALKFETMPEAPEQRSILDDQEPMRFVWSKRWPFLTLVPAASAPEPVTAAAADDTTDAAIEPRPVPTEPVEPASPAERESLGEAPAAQPPLAAEPVSEAPATEALATETPATEALATETLAEQSPTAPPPVADVPTIQFSSEPEPEPEPEPAPDATGSPVTAPHDPDGEAPGAEARDAGASEPESTVVGDRPAAEEVPVVDERAVAAAVAVSAVAARSAGASDVLTPAVDDDAPVETPGEVDAARVNELLDEIEAESAEDTAAIPAVHIDPATSPVVLRISGLSRRFGDTIAVDGIDLDVHEGSFYGIVGPNGAGKTTTLSMITGLLRPDSGSILVHGVDVWADPDTAKRSIGVLPDRLRLFDRLTGAQLLYYSGILRGLDGATVRSRVKDLARAFGLEDALNRLVTDYSAGMTKKVALAAAMIHSPRLLVLDEPFESVDPVSAANVIEILQKYVAHGGTVVLSSHGMDLIQRVCDHVAIIVNGQVLASGAVDHVRGNGTLEDRFVELAGGRKAAEGMEWLHSFSD